MADLAAASRWVVRRQVGAAATANAIDGAGLLVALVLLGRGLGPAAFGQFSAAYAAVRLAFLFTELGLASAITKGLARDFTLAHLWLGSALAIRLTTAAATTAAVMTAAVFVGRDFAAAVALLAMALVAWQASQLYVAGLRAEGRMGAGVFVVGAERAVLIGLVLTAMHAPSILPAASAFLVSGVARLVAAVALFRRLAPVPPPVFSVDAWRTVLRASLPFALTGILAMVSWRIDTLMLAWLLPRTTAAATVGLYNAAFSIFSGAALVGSASHIVLLPLLSRMNLEHGARRGRTIRRSLAAMALVGAAAAVTLAVMAPVLMRVGFGADYAVAAGPLRVLTPALLFVHISFAASAALGAADRALRMTVVLAAASSCNILLNTFLIPARGAEGAALATVASEGVACLLAVWYVRPLMARAT